MNANRENRLERLSDWPIVELIGGAVTMIISYIGVSVGNSLMAAAVLFGTFLWFSAYQQIRDGLLRRRYGRKTDNAQNR